MATMDDGLTARITAALDRAEEGDWPHRPSCQMLKPTPPGWPAALGPFTCNCDLPDLWLRLIAAHREILAICTRVEHAEGEARMWLAEEIPAILANAHRIEASTGD